MIAPCIRNSVSIVFFVPVFFSRQNYFRPTRFSNILQKQGGEGRGKKNVKTMENSITIRKLDLVCKNASRMDRCE